MLEHVPDPASTVAACARLVKPGGQVFLSTLNRNAKAYLFAVTRRGVRVEPDSARHPRLHAFPQAGELARLCRKAGLEVLEITGLRYNPFSRQGVIGGDTDINYLVRARRSA
jgi:2-polyprenyl-6-hydroxyphenyl methylase/3-demethylubiquinone-9 3-methyltransferase